MKNLLVTACLAFLSACASKETNSYPAHWWAKVPKHEAKWWEVLPQEAGENEVVLSKRNELGILSNFAETPFELDGHEYKSLEGFWQMMKYPEDVKSDPRKSFIGVQWPYKRAEVAQMIGFNAKKAGDEASKLMEKMGINWVTYNNQRMTYRTKDKGDHYLLIKRAMKAKLDQNRKVQEVLLSTGDLNLIPDHKQKPDASPAWKYYEIWMELRTELKQKVARQSF